MKKEIDVLKIKAIMQHYGLNQTDFSAKTGIPKTSVSKILSGERTCGESVANKILLAFDNINAAWLFEDAGQMLSRDNGYQTISGDITVTGNHNSHIGHGQHYMPAVIEIKENGVEVECPNCGEVIEVAETALTPLVPHEVMLQPDTNLAQFVKRNPEKLSTINLAQLFGNDAIAIEIDTRAMEPEFKEGHFLMIRKLPDLSYARADGTAYVVDAIRPHALLRYLTRERDGSYILTAENEKRTPIYLKAEEIYGIWQIEGGFWKRR
jgi:transcriptional regulator with XRE-family HTH domain